MRKKLSYLLSLFGVALLLAIGPEQAEAFGCTTELTCDSTNSHGAQLTGTNDIEYWEGTNCLSSWDCQYDDGYQTRHYGESLDPEPE